jgi:DNA excision repair protein ERCC-4
MKLPAAFPQEAMIVVKDPREQLALDVSPFRFEFATLQAGDYSVKFLEHIIAAERKSLPDLLMCIGQERTRFENCIQRLLGYPHRGLFIESTWQEIEAGQWRSKITSAAALGSLIGWAARGIPIFMCGDHERCGRYVARFLFTCARRQWELCRGLAAGILDYAPAELEPAQ